MGHIKAYYEGLTALSRTDWQYIAARFERICFLKGDILTAQGDTEQFLYFVEHGILRYYIPDQEHEVTFHFCFSKEFACAYDSLLTQTPSGYQLGALADTVAWRITYRHLQEVYTNTRAGNAVGRIAAEKLFF
ncbi:Crp/Fnr family transcriptional regulator [Parapedobacter deserti]|uniref:Crp/Fnr family transcriptional regulator n=1 Tax=Parapedobacter deserti TaxID=1912957 RepID=A0ABV7JPG9_9SPHI